MSIDFQEGMGGWDIVIKNKGYKPVTLSCGKYLVKRKDGYSYFDEDRAMKDARRIDEEQRVADQYSGTRP